ncbi:hypothetical protein F0U60_37000 [Archangium minus]|uniref:protein acetyllysine N-acetyltransferase n=1 Tax=Archangium minus TaxID=83450 RepID=A0ABY9X144_9BACT|nr:hypothetical protein F0U60_37000 [Archangium minus]
MGLLALGRRQPQHHAAWGDPRAAGRVALGLLRLARAPGVRAAGVGPGCEFTERVNDYAHLAPCPSCPQCGSVVRPEVVLFEELLPPGKVAVMEREFTRGFDLVFSIGTSSLFPYITAPVLEAAASQRPTVEINLGRTQLSDVVDVQLQLGAVAACEALWAVRERWKPRS